MVDRVLRENIADKVLMVGLAGNAFLKAKGISLGEKSEQILMEEFTEENLKAAKALLDRYGDRIETPIDVALDDGGMRKDVRIDSLPSELPISDIGKETAAKFSDIVSKACTVFISGPAGVIEKEEFSYGTKALMEATVSSNAFSVIGGGHTVSAAQRYHCCDRFSYVSTGGGALEKLTSWASRCLSSKRSRPRIKGKREVVSQRTLDIRSKASSMRATDWVVASRT